MNKGELNSEIEKAKAALAALEQKAASAINTPATKETLAPYGAKSFSDESRILTSFGAGNVRELLTKNTAAPEFAGIDGNLKQQVIQLKKMVDVSRLHSQFMNRDGIEHREMEIGEAPRCKSLFTNATAKSYDLNGRFKAFGTGVSGAGAEWLETAVSENYISELELEVGKVGGLFESIPMPTKQFNIPIEKDLPTAQLVAEGAAAVDNPYATSDVQFSAIKWVQYAIIPEELNEDSVFRTFAERARDQAIRACARAREQAILNGDTTGTHMDNDVSAATDARKAWKGLRKLALENSANGSTVDFSAAAATEAKLLDMLAAADRFGVDPMQCAWVVSPSSYAQLRGLPSVITLDKMGPNATILKGALASIFGVSIVVSQYVRQDLDATGVNSATPANNIKSCIYLVNTSRFMIGQRRPIRVVAAYDSRVEYDRQQVAAYERLDFKGVAQGALEKSVILGFNVLV